MFYKWYILLQLVLVPFHKGSVPQNFRIPIVTCWPLNHCLHPGEEVFLKMFSFQVLLTDYRLGMGKHRWILCKLISKFCLGSLYQNFSQLFDGKFYIDLECIGIFYSQSVINTEIIRVNTTSVIELIEIAMSLPVTDVSLTYICVASPWFTAVVELRRRFTTHRTWCKSPIPLKGKFNS